MFQLLKVFKRFFLSQAQSKAQLSLNIAVQSWKGSACPVNTCLACTESIIISFHLKFLKKQ